MCRLVQKMIQKKIFLIKINLQRKKKLQKKQLNKREKKLNCLHHIKNLNYINKKAIQKKMQNHL